MRGGALLVVGLVAGACSLTRDFDQYQRRGVSSNEVGGAGGSPSDGGGATGGDCGAGTKVCSVSCVSTADPAFGCESTSCAPCEFPNTEAVCKSGICAAGECAAGFDDCNGSSLDGCETNTALDPKNCGTCGNNCFATDQTKNWECRFGLCVESSCPLGTGNCNGSDTDGCEADFATDSQNCGFCGNACALPHATADCKGGQCFVESCDSGWDNCNGIEGDGCERDISLDPQSCGSCGQPCDLPNATATCNAGTCEIVSCNGAFRDCDGNAANGCEANTNSNANHCGGCGNPCAGSCSGGDCNTSCSSGTDDCDGNAANGCETNTNTDVKHCGGCGIKCSGNHGTPSCSGGNCGISCDNGWGDCNGNVANGCETNTDSDISHCGSCNSPCSANGGTPSCSGGSCSIVCDQGRDDCNGDLSDGCETNTNTDVDHCGGCGAGCKNTHGTASCSGGNCTLTCTGVWEDCDSNPANGCEVNTDFDLQHCGVCDNPCMLECIQGNCDPF